MRFRNPSRPGALHSCAVAATLAGLLAAGPVGAVEFGTASVMSGKGQRLKVAIPFTAQPGEILSVTQFQVVSTEAGDGAQAPDPTRFTLSMPMTTNMLILQSEELIYADTVSVVIGKAGNTDSNVLYDLRLP